MADSRWGEGVSEHKASAQLRECIENRKKHALSRSKSMSTSTASEELQNLHHAFCSLDCPGTHRDLPRVLELKTCASTPGMHILYLPNIPKYFHLGFTII